MYLLTYIIISALLSLSKAPASSFVLFYRGQDDVKFEQFAFATSFVAAFLDLVLIGYVLV
jgi:hypothetical protein